MRDPMTSGQRTRAKVTIFSALFIGRASMLAFVVYLFRGPFELNLFNSSIGWFIWNTILSFLFFIQHSGMIRRGLRARLANIVPGYYHDAIFCLASGITLVIVMVAWQSSGIVLIELQGPWRWLARGVFVAAVVGTVWGAMALTSFDPFGKGPIVAQLTGKSIPSQPFSIQGPYKFVRHPLYFFVLVMIWSCPDLTADRLLFNLLWSAWIYVGTVLEEKDLLAVFGEDYIRYQQKVPILIPWKGFIPAG